MAYELELKDEQGNVLHSKQYPLIKLKTHLHARIHGLHMASYWANDFDQVVLKDHSFLYAWPNHEEVWGNAGSVGTGYEFLLNISFSKIREFSDGNFYLNQSDIGEEFSLDYNYTLDLSARSYVNRVEERLAGGIYFYNSEGSNPKVQIGEGNTATILAVTDTVVNTHESQKVVLEFNIPEFSSTIYGEGSLNGSMTVIACKD